MPDPSAPPPGACHRNQQLFSDCYLNAPLPSREDWARPVNRKLTAWWTLTFPTLCAELGKAFERDIPLKDHDDWEAWLTAQRAAHQAYTTRIAAGETDPNARVYALFGLRPKEIAIIGDSTKYRYGEV